MKITYEIIRKLCDENKITVTGLEKELGFSKGSLCKIDKHDPGLEKISKICKRFNISMDDIVSADMIKRDDENNTWEISEDYYMDESAKEMAEFLFRNPEYKVLFDASRKVKPEDLQRAVKAIGLFTED